MPKQPELIDIAAEIRGESEKAWKLFDGTVEAWVPKSRCENNGDGTFTMESWLYDRAGFATTKQQPKPPQQQQQDSDFTIPPQQEQRPSRTPQQIAIIAKLQRWHKLLSMCTGGMVLTEVNVSKGKEVDLDEVRTWYKNIQQVINEVRETFKL